MELGSKSAALLAEMRLEYAQRLADEAGRRDAAATTIQRRQRARAAAKREAADKAREQHRHAAASAIQKAVRQRAARMDAEQREREAAVLREKHAFAALLTGEAYDTDRERAAAKEKAVGSRQWATSEHNLRGRRVMNAVRRWWDAFHLGVSGGPTADEWLLLYKDALKAQLDYDKVEKMEKGEIRRFHDKVLGLVTMEGLDGAAARSWDSARGNKGDGSDGNEQRLGWAAFAEAIVQLALECSEWTTQFYMVRFLDDTLHSVKKRMMDRTPQKEALGRYGLYVSPQERRAAHSLRAAMLFGAHSLVVLQRETSRSGDDADVTDRPARPRSGSLHEGKSAAPNELPRWGGGDGRRRRSHMSEVSGFMASMGQVDVQAWQGRLPVVEDNDHGEGPLLEMDSLERPPTEGHVRPPRRRRSSLSDPYDPLFNPETPQFDLGSLMLRESLLERTAQRRESILDKGSSFRRNSILARPISAGAPANNAEANAEAQVQLPPRPDSAQPTTPVDLPPIPPFGRPPRPVSGRAPSDISSAEADVVLVTALDAEPGPEVPPALATRGSEPEEAAPAVEQEPAPRPAPAAAPEPATQAAPEEEEREPAPVVSEDAAPVPSEAETAVDEAVVSTPPPAVEAAGELLSDVALEPARAPAQVPPLALGDDALAHKFSYERDRVIKQPKQRVVELRSGVKAEESVEQLPSPVREGSAAPGGPGGARSKNVFRGRAGNQPLLGAQVPVLQYELQAGRSWRMSQARWGTSYLPSNGRFGTVPPGNAHRRTPAQQRRGPSDYSHLRQPSRSPQRRSPSRRRRGGDDRHHVAPPPPRLPPRSRSVLSGELPPPSPERPSTAEPAEQYMYRRPKREHVARFLRWAKEYEEPDEKEARASTPSPPSPKATKSQTSLPMLGTPGPPRPASVPAGATRGRPGARSARRPRSPMRFGGRLQRPFAPSPEAGAAPRTRDTPDFALIPQPKRS